MTQPSALANFAISWSRQLDYCPGLSTVANLTYLFQKCVFAFQTRTIHRKLPCGLPYTVKHSRTCSDPYEVFLDGKTISRSVILLVPILGNIVIALSDLWNWRIKQNLISALKRNEPLAYNAAPGWLQSDREIREMMVTACINAISASKDVYSRLLPWFQTRDKIMTAAIRKGIAVDLCGANFILNDKELVLLVVAKDGAQLEHAKDLRRNEEVVLAAIKQNPMAIVHADETLQKNRAFLLKALEASHEVVYHIGPDFKMNSGFMLEALKKAPELYIGDPLSSDADFMREALTIAPSAITSLGIALRADSAFMLEIMRAGSIEDEHHPRYFVSNSLKDHLEFMLAAIEKDLHIQYLASDSIKQNPQFIEKVKALEAAAAAASAKK